MRFPLVLPIIAVGFLIAAQQVGHAQSRVAAPPVLHAGDSWTYRWEQTARGRGSGGTFTRQVVRKDTFGGQEVYIVSVTLRNHYDVVDLNLSRIARIDGAGNIVVRYTVKGDKFFPLTVGRTFTRQTDDPATRRSTTHIYTVVKVEDIVTAAGPFQTVKVSVEGEGTWSGTIGTFSEQGLLHFAPAAKVFVKMSSREWDAGGTTIYSEELVSYKITKE